MPRKASTKNGSEYSMDSNHFKPNGLPTVGGSFGAYGQFFGLTSGLRYQFVVWLLLLLRWVCAVLVV